MLTVDGSFGEGGGQILRTSLALSLVTGQAFRIEKIRAGRKKPGLQRQHLVAVEAAAAVGGAEVEGAALGSLTLAFRPKETRPGRYRFAIGTAGSVTLVLETVLPPLLIAGGPSELDLEGGTHNPMAPPYEFLAHSFLPLVGRLGAEVALTLERAGFYPAGGGRLRARITPAPLLGRLELLERGTLREVSARALVSGLPRSIAERELEVVRRQLGWEPSSLAVEERSDARGPGNVLLLVLRFEHLTEVFAGFGERGVRAETVAGRAVGEARAYLDAGAPVGPHLADQLLVPMAVGEGGRFRTLPLTPHATTNAAVIGQFLGRQVAAAPQADGTVVVEVA